MAVTELVDKITSAVERNESTLGIFLDLSKAFDTIDHVVYLSVINKLLRQFNTAVYV